MSTDINKLIDAMSSDADRRFALAHLHDWLLAVTPEEFERRASQMDVSGLEPLWQNYVAALVEQAAELKSVSPPAWLNLIKPLEEPWFGVPWPSLREYLLAASPDAFRRRNIFVDTGLGSRD